MIADELVAALARAVLEGEGDPLAQLEELTGHRWDGHVLLQLAAASQPLRRTDLAGAVSRAAGARVSDGQLDRTLGRVITDGHVRYHVDSRQHKWYQLTPAGRRQADKIAIHVWVQLHTHPGSGQDLLDRARAVLDGGRGPLPRQWAHALRNAKIVPLDPVERHRLLSRLAARLEDALHARPFDPCAARAIGQQLVAAGCTTPDALGATITALAAGLGHPDPANRCTRLIGLIAELAAGWAQAARDRTLDAQESLHAAAITAHAHNARRRRPADRHHRLSEEQLPPPQHSPEAST